MNRPRKIREVYHELRSSSNESLRSLDLLECADALVELFSDSDKGPRCEIRTGGVPFDQWSLDKVFADGGWRVMGREYEKELEIEQLEINERVIHNGLSRWFMEVAA